MLSHTPILQTLPSGLTFEMIPVGPGRFMMGSEDEDASKREQPVHEVRFDYSYAIGKFPVTQELWTAVFSKNNPSQFKGHNRPVECVSWYDAVIFCNALNELCGLAPVYFEDDEYRHPFGKIDDRFYELRKEGNVFRQSVIKGFRLPSEAEWEYAARGGPVSQNLKCAGSNILDEAGWYDENSHSETKPVGLKLPNELGIHDMSGNVLEWCEDHWSGNYDGAPDNGSAWIDKEKGDSRVLRGGSWDDYARNCRSSGRDFFEPSDRFDVIGFRLVLFPLPV